jgi:hypothetical protein
MIAPKRKTTAPSSSDTDGRYNHEHIMMILSWCYHVWIRGSLWLDGSSNRTHCSYVQAEGPCDFDVRLYFKGLRFNRLCRILT